MEPPKITVSAANSSNASSDVPKKTIRFQCGLLRETETFVGEDLEELCRDNLLDYVCDMLNTKVNIPGYLTTKQLAARILLNRLYNGRYRFVY